MGCDLSVLEKNGFDTAAGIEFTGGEDNYISAIQRYYRNYEKNKTKIEEYFTQKDFESYMITVHALKSNSKMIGAVEVSKIFEALEMAARNNDTDFIIQNNASALKKYDEVVAKIKTIGEMSEVRAAGEISADVARETSDKLIEALDDFDYDTAKALAEKLSGYPFRITQKEKLKTATAYIEDFMYDEAADLIREIYSEIE
ncbi:MAG: hypothetical protein K5776_01705 [Lachnospiraceae bacterium]|nr:hypothetical protein [Lachnospiraceae bacterium]